MVYEIYVISNSDLFREGLNAIAAFCQGSGFQAATWIGASIGITLTAMAYVRQHDVLLYLKWLATYFLVFNILLGVPSTVAIINTSDQTVPAQIVDHVPFGIAFPAHLITALGYGFSIDMETVFTLPNEEQYLSTGMLFGSNLFRLSLASQLDDPETMNDMNNYVKSCVVGDILINNKYSLNDLLHAEDIWALMTSSPSPIRGMFIHGTFQTCVQAASILTKKINEYSAKTAPSILARFIPTRNAYAPIAINNMLESTYQYFESSGKTSTDILKQNIAINAFRLGLKNYADETGSVAGLENMANVMAMNNTRMAWATSQHIGIQTLPLMQVVLLLLLICIFPLIAVLTLIPNLGIGIFKHYLYSLLWLETWPMMYAILNMAMNFYMKSGHHEAVTLSSINLLAQEHSDIASIAGYLVLAIPFLSLGIVKGMAFTFNNAAQYLGGMMHSIAQGSSASVVTGNYSLGNVSTDNATANNLSANKHDTNFTSMSGLSTQQLGNAATVTTTSMGQHVYSVAQGMSQIATSVNVAETVASSLSQQIDSSITSAFNHSTQYMQSRNHNDVLGTSSTNGVNANLDHAMTKMDSMAQSLAQREGIDTKDAYQRLAGFSGSLSASLGGKINNIGLNASAGINGSSTSTHDGSYSVGSDKNISASDARDFRDAMNTVKSYAQTHSYSNQNSDTENLAIQIGADLNRAERMSNSANFIETHSQAINTNASQVITNDIQSHIPNSQAILSNTDDPSLLAEQQQLVDRYSKNYVNRLMQEFSSNSHEIQRELSPSGMPHQQKYMMQNYQKNSHDISSKGNDLGINTRQAQHLITSVNNSIVQNNQQIDWGHQSQLAQREQLKASTDDKIRDGKDYAQSGVTHHIVGGIVDTVRGNHG